MASRRMKIFTAYYAMLYVIICLVLNLLNTNVAFFKDGAGQIVYSLIAVTVQAPFIYGLVRGLATKDYRISEGLKAFGETKNYGVYGMYIAVTVVFDALEFGVSLLGTDKEGSVLIASTVLSAVLTLFKLVLNMFFVKLYLDAINADGRLDLSRTLKGCIGLLTKKPLKIVAAELLMLIAGGASTVISIMLVGLLPKHWVVPLIVTSINSVQYGFIIISWPVYYLYYKNSFEEE